MMNKQNICEWHNNIIVFVHDFNVDYTKGGLGVNALILEEKNAKNEELLQQEGNTLNNIYI